MATLAGRAVLVIGGSSGIGLATASAAAAEEAVVTIAGRSQERLASAAAKLPGATTLVLDVTDESTVCAALAEAGTFDHVVVSVGGGTPSPVRGRDTVDAMSAFNAKFWGAYRVAASVQIVDRGSLTLVSGVFAQRPAKGNVAASCVNAAVDALARGLALELSPIRVNAVSPGLVDTPLWAGMAPDRRAALFAATAERLPNRHMGQPEDIAALILACITNPMLTGSVLVADGGHVLI